MARIEAGVIFTITLATVDAAIGLSFLLWAYSDDFSHFVMGVMVRYSQSVNDRDSAEWMVMYFLWRSGIGEDWSLFIQYKTKAKTKTTHTTQPALFSKQRYNVWTYSSLSCRLGPSLRFYSWCPCTCLLRVWIVLKRSTTCSEGGSSLLNSN